MAPRWDWCISQSKCVNRRWRASICFSNAIMRYVLISVKCVNSDMDIREARLRSWSNQGSPLEFCQYCCMFDLLVVCVSCRASNMLVSLSVSLVKFLDGILQTQARTRFISNLRVECCCEMIVRISHPGGVFAVVAVLMFMVMLLLMMILVFPQVFKGGSHSVPVQPKSKYVNPNCMFSIYRISTGF